MKRKRVVQKTVRPEHVEGRTFSQGPACTSLKRSTQSQKPRITLSPLPETVIPAQAGIQSNKNANVQLIFEIGERRETSPALRCRRA